MAVQRLALGVGEQSVPGFDAVQEVVVGHDAGTGGVETLLEDVDGGHQPGQRPAERVRELVAGDRRGQRAGRLTDMADDDVTGGVHRVVPVPRPNRPRPSTRGCWACEW